LNDATLKIAGGRLDLKVNIQTNDEIEELGDTFNHMTVELVKMKERAENANPLTKLPGNNVIREEIQNRIRQSRKFVVIHSDLDNFKAFNDKYGIGEGDKAIELTARLFKEAIEKKGDREDFVGHEGGDDFVVITTPERAEELAKYFIQRFDSEDVKYYTEEDRKKGYIEAKNRQAVLCKFPLMSISLAGVGNHVRNFKSYAEITNVMPELKEKAKAQPGSVFLLDRRKDR
jgi:diguanylate cyclase (GGDEF)-like protein